jgi:cytochrome bd ubiquinol oxidase subunit I
MPSPPTRRLSRRWSDGSTDLILGRWDDAAPGVQALVGRGFTVRLAAARALVRQRVINAAARLPRMMTPISPTTEGRGYAWDSRTDRRQAPCRRKADVHRGRGRDHVTGIPALLAPVLTDVNPVPWARSQMAFTLGFHIILVPLGVSWAVMTLIANYRGVKHGDADALRLAHRWSKYMAVTFAVGAVTGTVLTFEFALLWPRFMGQWGAAFGVPFAFEGLFFFTEAVFISIYIFGWRRLKPWAHFWTGVPIAVAGVFGSISVVAANAWMNSPEGVTVDSSGKVTHVDSLAVLFNSAMPLMAAHMVIAAYLVGGFLIASVYAVAMLRGRRDRYHRLGFIIGFTVAAIATPIQMGVGDGLARWVYNNQPVKFAAIEMVPATSRDVPETLFGHLNSSGKVVGGVPIPGLASILSDPSTGTSTVVQGLDTVPSDERPTDREVDVVHLAWDIMVGLGTLLFLLTLWYWASWIFRRDLPKSKWFLRAAATSGVLSVITLEAGWTVSEVGRQPWIVYEKMRVEDAATGNTGIWVTFVGVLILYVGLGVTTVLVLRGMSRRARRQEVSDERDAPYGPVEPSDKPEVPVG